MKTAAVHSTSMQWHCLSGKFSAQKAGNVERIPIAYHHDNQISTHLYAGQDWLLTWKRQETWLTHWPLGEAAVNWSFSLISIIDIFEHFLWNGL